NANVLMHQPISRRLSMVPQKDAAPSVTDFSKIENGFYDLVLQRRDRDPLLISARVDTVEAPGKIKFTVIWLDPDNKLKRRKQNDFGQIAREFATFIGENQKKVDAAAGKTDTPDLEYISKEDGELRHFLNLTTDL